MAIPTTYATLQTEVLDWTKRSDMTSRVTLFIAMAERIMNARLRLRIMEATEALTLSSGNDYVALPSRFAAPVSLVYTSSAEPLVQVDRDSIDAAYGVTGRPSYYAIGGQIDFDKTADTDYALTLRYVKKLDLANDLSNDVLTAAPFAYLYGALVAFKRFVEDSAGVVEYMNLFNQELASLEAADSVSRGVAPMRTDLAGVVGSTSFDITTG